MPDHISFHAIAAETLLSVNKEISFPVFNQGAAIRRLLPELDFTSDGSLWLRRSSLYDLLPELLFHENIHPEVLQDVTQMATASRRSRQEEVAARRFFLPFDRLLFEHSSKLTAYSLRTARAGLVLPGQVFLHDRSLQAFAQQLSGMFKERINISCEREVKVTTTSFGGELGNISLAQTFVAGSRCYMHRPTVMVTIGPLMNTISKDFMPYAEKGGALRRICINQLPVESIIEWKVLPHPSELCGTFQLGHTSFC